MPKRKCKAKNRAGKPCGNYPMKDLDYCWIHRVWRAERPFWQNPGFYVPLVIALGIFAFQLVTGPTKRKQQQMLNKQDEQLTKTEKMKDTVTRSLEEVAEDQKKIMEALKSIHASIAEKKLTPEDVEKQSRKTYEVARNFNANLFYKKGYEKEGTMGVWFTPQWKEVNTRKFFLLDFVGELDKNRMSIFFEKTELVYRILTSDGREETLSLDTASWKSGTPYLISADWDTNRDWVEVGAGEKDLPFPPQIVQKTIHNLHFDKLGPLLFVGIDFEGKYPAKLKRGSLGYSITKQLQRGGWEEYEK